MESRFRQVARPRLPKCTMPLTPGTTLGPYEIQASSARAIWARSTAPGANMSAVAQTEADGYWPQWRGPLATGVAPDADPPTECFSQ